MRYVPLSLSPSFICSFSFSFCVCVCHILSASIVFTIESIFFGREEKQKAQTRDLCTAAHGPLLNAILCVCLGFHYDDRACVLCIITHCTIPYMVLQLDKTV